MIEVDYINGPYLDRMFGMARYEREIFKRITDVQFNHINYQPVVKLLEKYHRSSEDKDTMGISPLLPQSSIISRHDSLKGLVDKTRLLGNYMDRYRYQRIVKEKIKYNSVKHITNQEMAYLLNSVPMKNSLVTCHDLIPWVFDQDRSRIWKQNIDGLKKADRIITVSEFSKQEIVQHLNYPETQVEVIYDAVDPNIFHPRAGLKNSPEEYQILYVGSETPRMNLPFLLKVLAKLKKLIPNIKLIKLGDPQSYGAREKILTVIKDLNLQHDVKFLGYISDDELPFWYNRADVLVYPCLYAGFGLPPLEAMASGTPVITSNTTSLPEVVEDAGFMVEPDNVDGWVSQLYQILTMEKLKEKMIKKGLKQSQKFSWDDSAIRTKELYAELYDEG